MAGVVVVAEVVAGRATEATLEALGEAVDLARSGAPAVVAVGPPAAGDALEALGAHGAGRLVLLETDGDATAEPPAVAAAVARWLGGADPTPTALLPHSVHGHAVAPLLAVALDAALVPDATALRRAADGGLMITRPAYGERLQATLRIAPETAAVVTLRPGALGVGPVGPPRPLTVERVPAETAPCARAARRRRVIDADPRLVDLRDAERIVAGGRGVGGPEGFRLLQALADLLGAAVGGSRVAVDLGWLPWERQVGQSGRPVAPDLYVAIGISGASQHLAGIERARTVVAVNADRDAPILDRAQFAVVGDWEPVVAGLVERLRRRAASSGDQRAASPSPGRATPG